MPRSSAVTVVSALVAGGAVALLLSGCIGGGSDDPSPRPSASASRSASESASASPAPSAPTSASASPSPTAGGTPIARTCLELVPLDTMYAFDPNFGLDDSYSPALGSAGAAAVADSGLACGWVQQTSGERIEIAVAQPTAERLADLNSAAAPDGTGRAFSSSGGQGTVQAFSGPYWVVATSPYFTSAADAAPLIDSAVAALG